MKLEEGMYVRTDKGYISKILEFKEHYTKGKRTVDYCSVKEVEENYLLLGGGNQCQFVESIDYSIPRCYPSDEEWDKIKIHIIKASYDIIDLIEVGDYVNGSKVIALRKDISEKDIHPSSKECNIFTLYTVAQGWYFGIKDEDIKSIVTHEQFSQMEYKVVK